MCFDEFKSVKSAAGSMSFLFCDSTSRNIVDIVEDRRLHILKNYFLRYSKNARLSVKTIVIDIYSPYISLIKDVFPKAKIIIDTFHIVQLFSRALNKTRIKIMNQNKKNYNKLKKYWKLLLKDRSKVNSTRYNYHRSFKNLMREIDIIDYLLNLDPTLRASYELYHNIRSCIKMKDFARLNILLYSKHPDISNYMKTSIRTIKKYIDYVENTLKYPLLRCFLKGKKKVF
ncbi:transposase [Garciella nitratireducens]